MDLNTIWFILIAVLYIGFFLLEGFDFGVGILLPFLSRDKDPESCRPEAAHDHQYHRTALGRQRSLAADGRRGDLCRFSPLVRYPVQRFLPGIVPAAAGAHPARRGLRVPQQR